MNVDERSHERYFLPNIQESSITFKNVFELSKKEDVNERYSTKLIFHFKSTTKKILTKLICVNSSLKLIQ